MGLLGNFLKAMTAPPTKAQIDSQIEAKQRQIAQCQENARIYGRNKDTYNKNRMNQFIAQYREEISRLRAQRSSLK